MIGGVGHIGPSPVSRKIWYMIRPATACTDSLIYGGPAVITAHDPSYFWCPKNKGGEVVFGMYRVV